MKIRTISKMLGAALLAVTLAAPAPVQAQSTMNITAVAAGIGSAWMMGLAAMGKLITSTYPGSDFKLLPGASMANPSRMNNGECDITVSQHTMAFAANAGQTPYKKKHENVRSLVNLQDVNRLHVFVPADSPIKSLKDIKEKKMTVRVTHGPIGSITELACRWVLGEYGMTYRDLRSWGGKNFPLSYTDAVSLFKDGQLDLFFWFGPGETAYIQEILSGMKLRWLPLDDFVVENISKKYGFKSGTIPGSLFNNAVGHDVATFIDNAEILAHKDLSEETVYNFMKLIMDNSRDISLACPIWTIDAENGHKNLAFPMHPGAVKFYKEKGVIK